MNDPNILGTTFQKYLQSGFDKGAAREMCRVLDHYGLQNESKALNSYLNARAVSSDRSGETDWDQRKCYSCPYPPPNPNINDVWFDVVDLMPMILISRENDPSPNLAFWLAMHPVYQWQFQGFL